MSQPISEPRSHFSSYYKDNFILIQFIIVEFIETYQCILEIETFFQELSNSEKFMKNISSLIQISKLLLNQASFQSTCSLHWIEGSLKKLKTYCENFCSNLHQNEKRGTQLHLALHHTELAAMYYLTLLFSLQLQLESLDDPSFLSLKRAFESLKIRFKKVVHSIPRLVSPYCHNENILLCLLRKKHCLTKIYGHNFLAKYFKCFLSPKELMHLLLKQYQIRGFFSLPHPIQKHIEES